MKLLLLVALSAAAVCLTVGATVAPFGAASRTRVLDLLESSRISATSGWATLESTFDALSAYKQLDTTVPEGKQLCASLQKSLTAAIAASDLDDIFHSAGSASLVQCPSFSAKGVSSILQTALDSQTVENIYYASQAALALATIKQSQDLDFSRVSSSLLELLEEDGTFRSNPEDAEGSAYHAGMAMATLGTLSAKMPRLVDKAILTQVADKVQALIKSGTADNRVDFTFGAPAEAEDTPLEVLAVVIDGLRAIAGVVPSPLDVKKTQIIQIGDYVLQNAAVSSPSDADALTTALLYLSDNDVFVPYYVAVQETATANTLKVRVTNIVDKPTTKLNVLVQTVKTAGKNGAVAMKDVVFQPASSAEDNVLYELNALSAAQFKLLAPGFYNFNLNLVPVAKDAGKYKTQADVVVPAKVSFTAGKSERVEIAFSDSPIRYSDKNEKDIVRSLKFPASVEDGKLSFDASKHVHVKLSFESASSYVPKSLFVQFASASGRSALFVLKNQPDETVPTYSLKMSLGSSELIEALEGTGKYTISVLYGDATLDRMVTWKIATVQLAIPTPGPARAALDSYFSVKPTLAHTFRQADARPMAIVPLIFTLLVLAPFVGLLMALAASGTTLALPTNPTEFLYAMVFQGSILAILLSYTLYWLSLNIFQALALSAVCGVVAVFSGTGALRMLHQRADGKAKKVE